MVCSAAAEGTSLRRVSHQEERFSFVAGDWAFEKLTGAGAALGCPSLRTLF